MVQKYRVLPHPSGDLRLVADRHTYTRFPVKSFASVDEVNARREELCFNLRMAAGLYPWPQKTPLNVHCEHVGDFDGFSIQKIMFESRPGFWSTGNLYLPRPLKGKSPAILNVIGHWWGQRLTRDDGADYPQQLANFARMGFVCLVTDMIGSLDSMQITHDYGGNEKELWQSNGLGVQLWNNIRALDVLCEMPEVDAERLGVTGASGGGSQTLFLSLLDERIKAAAPINMISLEMQGGCQCENAPGLRRHTNNGEMCAMLAPRPLFLAGSTGDWTRNQIFNEFPMIQNVYRLYGAEEKVEQFFQVADHQYNELTRHRVYQFFARTLMNRSIVWEEQPVQFDDLYAFTWFRGQGHAPGFANDDDFFSAHKEELRQNISRLDRNEKLSMLRWITGIQKQNAFVIPCDTLDDGDITIERSVVASASGAQLPVVQLTPKYWDYKRVCLAIGSSGKDCLNHPQIKQMLHNGVRVISGELFMTGESAECSHSITGDPLAQQFFTTFHYTKDAYRIQDVALLCDALLPAEAECTLWADGTAARAAACALPFLTNIKSALLENKALRLPDDKAYNEQFFVPGIMLIGAIEGCLHLASCPVIRF